MISMHGEGPGGEKTSRGDENCGSNTVLGASWLHPEVLSLSLDMHEAYFPLCSQGTCCPVLTFSTYVNSGEELETYSQI